MRTGGELTRENAGKEWGTRLTVCFALFLVMHVLVRECYLFPVKSCAGVRVDELAFDEAGQIVGDREWVIVDEKDCMTWMGAIPRLAQIRPIRTANGWSLRSPANETMPLPPGGKGDPCSVQAWNSERAAFDSLPGYDAGDAPARFVSAVAGKKVRVVWLATQQHRPNPIHLTTLPSLRELAAHLGVDSESPSFSRRFRPNVVLDSAPGEVLYSFVEEKVTLLKRSSSPPLTLEVSGKCARCIVVDVDPDVGQTDGRYFTGTKMHSALRHGAKEAWFGIYARARGQGHLATGEILTAEL